MATLGSVDGGRDGRSGAPRQVTLPSPARRTGAAGALLLALLAAPLAAQIPSADWRTLEVPGYRVHYPAPAEPWARHLAARLPALRARVATSVGFDDPQVVDVVLADPLAQANGMALPLLPAPRMVLLLTPPEAGSGLENHADWVELLAIHEQAHLSHLLRPSRRPLERWLRLPVGPIALRAPRWVTEGYATLLEAQLTGRGRPHGALRAAVLRRWAQLGRLPSYRALGQDRRHYLGSSMAYLAGSAFLEWLQAGATSEPLGGAPGPTTASLDHLWRRLTARRGRSFEEAFRGVFGESPAALWGRFSAELTWKAIELERQLAPTRRDGDLWLERSWGTGRPALSRDGRRLVLALHERDRPSRLALFPLDDDHQAARRQAAERERRRRADPEDVPAVEAAAPARRPLATLELPGSTVAADPRFLPDGSVLFARTVPAPDGTLHPDLFRWWPERGRVTRLTHRADLKSADPSPDGSWAVAVRSRWGRTALVRVDLASGATSELTAASVGILHDAPRLSADGRRLAYLRHDGTQWRLVVRELAAGDERVLATPDGAALADPAWAPAGDAVYLTVGEPATIDVQAIPLAAATPRRTLTRVPGAALGAEPTPDGQRLFFLSLDPDGLEVRTIGLDEGAVPEGAVPGPELAASGRLAPAVAPAPPPAPAPLPLAAVPAGRSYGLGHPEWSLLQGGSSAAAGSSLEAGLRGGELLGRWELLALGAAGGAGGLRGATLAAAWRGWPVALAAQLYRVEDAPSHQPREVPALGSRLDRRTSGFELAGSWERAFAGGRVHTGLALGHERRDPAAGPARDRDSVLLHAGVERTVRRGPWLAELAATAEWQPGETAGARWDRRRAELNAALGRAEAPTLRLGWQRSTLDGATSHGDDLRLGGQPSSLLPATAAGERLLEPALPAGALVGDGHQGQQLALEPGTGLPLRAIYRRHRIQRRPGTWSDWLALVGLELDLELPALPLVRLPATRLQAGLAYILDPPFAGDVNGWVGVAYRP